MTFSAKYQIIIPVFNRREITLKCLRQLASLIDRDDWKVCLVDDASTDGTAAAVSAEFPEVLVLEGTGNLYWTGVMELGMRHAVKTGAECCVWMNDDLQTDSHAIHAMVMLAMERQAIVAAEGVVQHENRPPYYSPGFYRKTHRLETRVLDLNALEPIPVDGCRGNMVAIPKSVIDVIGYPDSKNMPHYWGDVDYSLRATKVGIPCLITIQASFFEAETVRSDNRSWLLDSRSPCQVFQATVSIKGMYYPRGLWVFGLRHWGWWGIYNFCFAYAKLSLICLLKWIVPRRVLLKLYAKRSHSFCVYEGISEGGFSLLENKC